MRINIIQKIKTAPKNPGVYIFYRGPTPLYVGKASNLKNRLQNYLKITDYKTETLHQQANELKLIKLRSNIEALIEESKLIKSLKPQLNILWRDDKNYFYAAITKEKFPRIYITHQPSDAQTYVGPFTEGQSIKAVLRLLRKFFPYCSCQPHFRLCLNTQINNCPGYCCNLNSEATTGQTMAYNKNIQRIKKILDGEDKKFIKKLKDPYELLILEKIWAHKPYLQANSQFNRAECYDNSHFSGKEAVGAMTAWKNVLGKWVADKNLWRKFKIRGRYTEDDPKMMKEIINRRFNHPEWPYPDLIIIDGGIAQLNAVKMISKLSKIISFAKPRQLIYGWGKKPIPVAKLPEDLQKLIKTAIQQTHNFVQRYHREIRQKDFLKL